MERVDGLAQPVGGEVGGGGQQLVVEVGAGAQGPEDRAGRRCELVHFGPQRRHQRGRGGTGLGREPPAGHDAVGRPRRQGQADQRGHAAAVVVEGVDQPVVDGGAEHDGGELAHLGLLQRAEGDERLGSAEQRVERRQRGIAGRGPVGDHQGDALGRRPFRHADDHPERPGIEPLGVVDDEGDGGLRGQAVEQPVPVAALVAGVRPVQQVVHGREGVVPLQAPAGQVQDGDTAVAEAVDDGAHDRRRVGRPPAHDADLRRHLAVGRGEGRHTRHAGRQTARHRARMVVAASDLVGRPGPAGRRPRVLAWRRPPGVA